MTTFPHVLLTAQGSLGLAGGDEIWSCGLKIGLTETLGTGPLLAASQTDVDEISALSIAAWETFVPAAGSGQYSGIMSDLVLLAGVKAAAKIASGKDDPTLASVFTPAAPGTRGNAPSDTTVKAWAVGSLPYSVAVAVTLRGPLFPRGSASHGRFYMPVPNIYVDPTGTAPLALTDGLMAPASVSRLCARAAAMVATLNTDIVLSSGKVAQVVNVGRSTDAAGTRWQPIDSVSIDNRPDTIRRRSNKISGRGRVTVTI